MDELKNGNEIIAWNSKLQQTKSTRAEKIVGANKIVTCKQNYRA
jgi:hypothetical protein